MKYRVSELPSSPTNEYVLPALTAGIQNQGLNSFVPKEKATILKNVISISANGANTGVTFYQNTEFTVLQDAYAIKWKLTNSVLTDSNYLFLTCSISKAIFGNYEWTNKAGWERIKSEKIQLPIKHGEIDFTFMEEFITELEAQRIAELEAYLSAAGLKNFELTLEEEQVLSDFAMMEFESFKVVDVFQVKNSGNILSRDIVENSGQTPYLCASSENNAVSSYISFNEALIDKGNCVFIGGKTFVVSYQEKDFYSNDSHNLILYLKNESQRNKLNHLFLATCVDKGLGHKYSWGNSISNKKIQTDVFMLPTQNHEPNFAFMRIFISAVQKLVIKDVVHYADKKIAATNQVVQRIS